MVEIGKVDRLHSIIGQRGVGKSHFLVRDAHAVQRQFGSILLGHSPGARLPERFHLDRFRTRDSQITWHDDLRSLDRALRHPEKVGRFHVMADGSPEELIAFARALSLEIRRSAVGRKFRANRPPPPGTVAQPIHVAIDEGIALATLRKNSQELDEWKVWLTGLRHEHMSLTYGIQSPTAKNWALLEQSTDITTFRYQMEWGLNVLRATGIVPKEDLGRIQRLPDFTYLQFNTRRAK